MENYRAKLQKRNRVLGLLTAFTSLLLLCTNFGILNLGRNDEFAGIVTEFQSGLLCWAILLFARKILKTNAAVKDDLKLRKLYNEENDERKKAIREKCGAPVILISSVAIIFAGIIGGYFNEIIFFSLVVCGIVQLIVCAVMKFYYLKKY